ncbi:hypothetical protein ACP70R_010892 [Stipagrostis hirtigluma subsp. patula]
MAYIPIFLLLLLSSLCQSDDQLTQSKPLSPGDMLISKDGIFALGFFSPTNSNKSLYIGIWYHDIPVRTIVWVANRDNPITMPSTAKLTITKNQEIVLSDSEDHTLWTTAINTTARGVGAVAVLLGSGNFVLQSPNGTVIWQSFDHPTDTILPTMRFLMSYRAQVVEHLVAWKGPDDPSTGDFSFSIDPTSNLQMFIWHKTWPYYRSAVFYGESVTGGSFLGNATFVLYQETIDTGIEFYFRYRVSDGTPYTRFLLDYTGTLSLLSWNKNMLSWTVISHSGHGCDLYGSCGPFGYCDFTAAAAPMCRCLDGFEPKDLNFSRGCRRKEALQCGKEEHFVTLAGMKVPDKFLHIPNRSFDQCAAECSKNCSCLAYAYANLSSAGTMADTSRCLVWTGDLVDLWKASNLGENLYLRLAESTA